MDYLSTEKAYELDVRDFKGKNLARAIEEAVKDTQSVIIRSYPDKLVITQAQYNILTNKPQMLDQDYDGQEYHLYKTKLNIMEVIIK